MTGAALKILAMIAMTVDHIGLIFFSGQVIFRQIGRLAFPIFAFMIAEGCRHTRNMWRYFATVALVAAICQVAYYFAMGSVYQCVLVSFSLSIALIGLIQFAQNGSTWRWLLPVLGLGGVYFVTQLLPGRLSGTDFSIDYGFWGVMLPVVVYLGKNKGEKLALATLALLALGMEFGGVQFYGLLAVPMLALYNGKRGKGLGKSFFYIFYPAHLLLLQGISWFL